MEHFISEIGRIVFPELKSGLEKEEAARKMELLLPTLNLLVNQAENFSYFRTSLSNYL